MARRTKFLGAVAVAVAIVIVSAVSGVFAGSAPEISADETTVPKSSTTSVSSPTSVTPPVEDPTGPSSTPPTAAEVESTTTSAPAEPSTTVPSGSTTTLVPAEDPDAGQDVEAPVALGEAIVLGEWRVGVSAVELDATETILNYVDFNEPPAEGHQYVLVELSGVHLGDSFIQPVFDWALVKPGFTHVPDGLECGVVPNSIYDLSEIPTGDQFTANVCFEVPTAEMTDDLVLTLGLLDESGRERFFALR